MKYVLDSSVALKWVLPEADSAKAIRLRDEYKNGVHELLAPDIFMPEIANGLASAERQGRIKTGESAVLLLDVIRAAPAIHPTPPLLLRAMGLAIANQTRSTIASTSLWRKPKGANWRRPTTNLPAAFGRPIPSSSPWRHCPDAACSLPALPWLWHAGAAPTSTGSPTACASAARRRYRLRFAFFGCIMPGKRAARQYAARRRSSLAQYPTTWQRTA